MKKIFALTLSIVVIALFLYGCAATETKIVHCDNCGKEIKVSASSNVDDDWTLYCDECNEKLGIDSRAEEILDRQVVPAD